MGVWKTETDGTLGVTEPIDADDLGLVDDDATWYYLAVEHPVPLIPNIRVSSTPLKASGSGTLSADFTFDDVTFPADTVVASDIDLSHVDYTLYYEILDNYVSLDLGLTARNFDGSASMEAEAITDSITVDEVVPMLYSRVQVDLPLTGFYVGGTINYAGMNDNSLEDLEVRVGYMAGILPAEVGVEVGYRSLSLNLEEENEFQSDISFDGTYAAIVFHF